MKHQQLTQSRLRELLTYCSKTGEFVRKIRVGNKHPGTKAGSTNFAGYILIVVDGVRYRAHHLAWLYVYGNLPRRIDHKDRNRSNNAIANLREITHAQKMHNVGFSKANKSGFKGVRPHPVTKNRWLSQISVGGKAVHLGSFASAEAASTAYTTAKATHHPYAQKA